MVVHIEWNIPVKQTTDITLKVATLSSILFSINKYNYFAFIELNNVVDLPVVAHTDQALPAKFK